MSFKVAVTRAAQLKPGDLFIFADEDGESAAILATDPTDNGQRLIVALGPSLPEGQTSPTLLGSIAKTVISFGHEYTVRLPCQPNGWLTTEPPGHVGCLVVTESDIYLRVRFRINFGFNQFYLNIANGEILSSSARHEFIPPTGTKAYAINWDLLTTEKEPRIIISYPMTANHISQAIT